ncbi:MAG TPA: hypothetical protein VES79_09425, partial [Solirubrobacteraceae bacterium]|nr:hypothetical protein [Solirubrobacteraceae bacterium]
DALVAGQFSATLTGASRGAGPARKIVLATGARSVSRAGRYSLKLKLTRQGMRLLRSKQTAKITVTIKFRDASGRITTARETLRLRR